MSDLTLPEILQLLADRVNQEAVEYNELVDHAEKLESEIERLKLELTQMPDAMEALATLQGQVEQYRSMKTAAERKLAEALARHKVELAGLKDGNPKDKELIKRLKREKEELQKDNAALRKQVVDAAREKAIAIKKAKDSETFAATMTFTSVYTTEKELLMYFPKQVISKVDGERTDVQRSLFWMDRKTGRGGLITLDHDNLPVMGKAPAGGLKVSKEVENFAGAWLRKVKAQGNVVTHDDFMALSTYTED